MGWRYEQDDRDRDRSSRQCDPSDRAQRFHAAVREEYKRARKKHPPMYDLHQAKAIIEEEFDEWWAEVKMKRPDLRAVRSELIQMAAMCLSVAVELLPDPDGE